jgi:hypothetical protein
MTNKFELDLDAIPYNTQYMGGKPPARITGGQIRWAAENCLTEHAIENGHQKILLAIADQLDPQTKPVLPEPGRYAVVKAALAEYPDAFHEEWVSEGKFWVSLDGGTRATWNELVDPVLVREGV